MRVNIGSLKGKQGCSIKVGFRVEALPGIGPGDLELAAPVVVTATITNSGRMFIARGEVSTTVRLECSRCLKTYDFPLVAQLEEEYFPAAEGKANATDGQFASESVFTGDTIDLAEAVREQTMLALPYQALCSADCAGLCVKCGKDLNTGECGCARESIDPRLADLARLLNGSQDSSGNNGATD